jgi:hypothetical protein
MALAQRPKGARGMASRDSLADEVAIRDVLHRYAFGVDARDFAMQRACFTEDVEAEYGGHRLPRGVDGILTLNRGAAGFVSTMHHAGTTVILSLTADSAETEHYSIACLLAREDDGGHVLTMRGVRYSDAFRREDGEWRICRRRHNVLWATTAGAIASPPLPAQFLEAAGIVSARQPSGTAGGRDAAS